MKTLFPGEISQQSDLIYIFLKVLSKSHTKKNLQGKHLLAQKINSYD